MNTLGGKYEFETVGNTYRYVIPTQKQWLRIGMNALLLVVLAILLFPSDLSTILKQGVGQLDPRILLVDGIAVILLALMALDVLYQVAGKEVVEISDDAVVIRHHILGIGPSRRTRAEKVSGMVVSPDRYQPGFLLGSRYGFFDFGRGWVALGGGKERQGLTRPNRFGASLGEAEARQLLGQILSRFPQYRVAEANPSP